MWGREGKRKHLSTEEAQAGVEASFFRSYRLPLSTIAFFKYLGRVLTAAVNNWAAVISNMKNVRKWWTKMSHMREW